MLVYKIPREPTAGRVAVWRKLQRLGALLLHDAVWVLPPTPRNREELQWLSAEIRERGGEALLWDGSLVLDGRDDSLIERFRLQVEPIYTEILAEIEQPDADLTALSRRYQQARGQDYFSSPLGQQVRAALLAAAERPTPCGG